MNDKSRPVIDQSIKAHFNRGNITQTNNNTVVNNIPEPEFKWGEKIVTNLNGGYLVEYDLNIQTPFPVGEVWFEACGGNARDLEVESQRTGIQFSGHTGNRGTHCFTSIQHATGPYKLKVSADDTNVKIKYGYDR